MAHENGSSLPEMSPDDAATRSSRRQHAGLFLGPALLAVMLLLPAPPSMSLPAWRTAAAAVLMAVWWVSEALPLPATALLPLVLFPVLGILPIGRAVTPYANPVIFLFMGGFIMARALECSGLHRRIALAIIMRVGPRPVNLILGFMLATAFLSMWVSNTATVVMMLPMALSVVFLLEQAPQVEETEIRHFSVALLLGVAYAASIGGLGTLIGTPPNALLAGFMAENYHVEIGFVQWMLVGVPLVVVALPLTWYLLVRVVFPVRLKEVQGGRSAIQAEVRAQGRLSRHELSVGLLVLAVALAWVFRPFLGRLIPGLSDAGIAMAGAVGLFLLPVDWREGRFALSWKQAAQLPWGVLILFGGGLSLAEAIQFNGLSKWIGSALSGVQVLPPLLVTVIVTAVVVFLTELTSNTATAAAFLPLVASLAVGAGADPLLLVVPATLAASCAFMMPVATPPNAIVYGSERVSIQQMVRAGLWLNFLFIILINILLFGLAVHVFGISKW